MSTREPRDRRAAPQTSDLIRRLAEEVQHRTKRGRRRRKRSYARVRQALWFMALMTFVIIPGTAFGSVLAVGWQALLLVGLMFPASGIAALYWALSKPRDAVLPRPAALALPSGLAQLPAHTDDWLEEQRQHLPYAAQASLDSIGKQLEALAVQLQGVSQEVPGAHELRRLLSEELPELVRGYVKVPRALQQKPLNGGLSPERQLTEGLATIDAQLGRMHEQLAQEDLKALATHQRYLDLKYKRDDE